MQKICVYIYYIIIHIYVSLYIYPTKLHVLSFFVSHHIQLPSQLRPIQAAYPSVDGLRETTDE